MNKKGCEVLKFQPIEARRLRVYIGESSHAQHQPLYHVIVTKAREMGLAGATVIRGVEGFGLSHRIHSSNLLALSSDLPIVVEIIDRADRIDQFAEDMADLLDHGIVTVDVVEVRHDGRSLTPPE